MKLILFIAFLFLAKSRADYIAGDFFVGGINGDQILGTLDISVNPPNLTSQWEIPMLAGRYYFGSIFDPTNGLFYVLNYNSTTFEFYSVDTVANNTSTTIPIKLPPQQFIGLWKYDPVYGPIAVSFIGSDINTTVTDVFIYSIDVYTGSAKLLMEYKPERPPLFVMANFYDQGTHTLYLDFLYEQDMNGSQTHAVVRLPLSGGISISPTYSGEYEFQAMVYDPSTDWMIGLNMTWSQSSLDEFTPSQIKMRALDGRMPNGIHPMLSQKQKMMYTYDLVTWSGFDLNPTFMPYSPYKYTSPHYMYLPGGFINQDNSALIVFWDSGSIKIPYQEAQIAWYYKDGTVKFSDTLVDQDQINIVPLTSASYYY